MLAITITFIVGYITGCAATLYMLHRAMKED